MPDKPDIVIHGIRFYWDVDSESYSAQIDPDDLVDVFDSGYYAGYHAAMDCPGENA